MGEIVKTRSKFSRDAEPFVIQIAVENLANQRNLAIIAGSLATVSILMLEKLIADQYLWLFALAIIGLLLTALFSVMGSILDVERGSKNLQDKIDQAYEPSDRQQEILQQFILREINHVEANKRYAAIKDDMLKHLLSSHREGWRKSPFWQPLSHGFFVVSLSFLILFFLLRFVPLEWLEQCLTKLL